MAISRTTGSAANSASAASLALPAFNLTASQDVIVGVVLGSTASSVTSIVDTKGNTYSLIGAKNGTGMRVELWKSVNVGAQTSNIITVNISPNTDIAAAAEEYAGVSSYGNTGNNSGSNDNMNQLVSVQDGNNWIVCGMGFTANSGDTDTAVAGNLIQSSIPAATRSAVGLFDETQVAVGQELCQGKLSTARNWASFGVELRSGGPSITVVDYASTSAPSLQVARDVRFLRVKEPYSYTSVPTNFSPVPVAVELKGGTVGLIYSETISVNGGTAPYVFALLSGALPTGTNLNTSTGVISGTPSAAATFTFTIKVTDMNGYIGSQAFSITIAAPSGGGGAFTFLN